MKEYEGNMTLHEEIWRNMWKIWRSMKKYVKVLDLALPYLYGPLDLEKFRAPPSYSLWGLEKFHAGASSQALGLRTILSSTSIQALRFEKILNFPFLRLQPVGEAPSLARCEVSLFCLLHISSKLFLLTYSSKPQKCECLGRWLPQTWAVNGEHVSS